MLRNVVFAAVTACLMVGQLEAGGQTASGAGSGGKQSGRNAVVGHVRNVAGQPVPDVFVTALWPNPSGKPAFSMVSARLQSVTNAQGEFRLDNLPSGKVYLVALPHNQILTADKQINRSGYGKTFYPNVADLKNARLVAITPTGPTRAEITLTDAHLSVITGRVIGADRRPVTKGMLGITHGDGLFGVDSRGVRIRPDGTFIAPALPPGTYFLHFEDTAHVSQTEVTVWGADMLNVQVLPITMVRVTGHLVIAPADRVGAQISRIHIDLTPVDFDGNPGPGMPGVPDDHLAFELQTWPGEHLIRVFPEEDWSIRAIRLGGVDVTGKPIDFPQGRDVTGLEIEIAKRQTH